jgi:hypothetical protein
MKRTRLFYTFLSTVKIPFPVSLGRFAQRNTLMVKRNNFMVGSVEFLLCKRIEASIGAPRKELFL